MLPLKEFTLLSALSAFAVTLSLCLAEFRKSAEVFYPESYYAMTGEARVGFFEIDGAWSHEFVVGESADLDTMLTSSRARAAK